MIKKFNETIIGLDRKQKISIIACVINCISVIIATFLGTLICHRFLPENLYIGKEFMLYILCIGFMYIIARSILILIFKRPIFKLFRM